MRIDTIQTTLFRALRHAYATMNPRLAAYYRLCERTGFDLPAAESRTICLRAHEVVRLTRESRAKHLEVRHGAVWLTGTPARGDVLLRDGERFSLADGWPFVVQALDQAKVVLLP